MNTTAVNQFSGPAYVHMGNPATAAGAGMVTLGLLPNVSVKPIFHNLSADNEIGAELADGQFTAVIGAEISMTVHQKTAAILKALMPQIVEGAGSLAFSEQFQALSAPTMCVQPIAGYGEGPEYADNIWIPKVRLDDVSEFIRNLGQGAGKQSSSNPFTVRMSALLDGTMDEDFRIMFFGDPADATKTWYLPSGY